MTDRTVNRICADCGITVAVSAHASAFKRCAICAERANRARERERQRLWRRGQLTPAPSAKTKTVECAICSTPVTVSASAVSARYCRPCSVAEKKRRNQEWARKKKLELGSMPIDKPERLPLGIWFHDVDAATLKAERLRAVQTRRPTW